MKELPKLVHCDYFKNRYEKRECSNCAVEVSCKEVYNFIKKECSCLLCEVFPSGSYNCSHCRSEHPETNCREYTIIYQLNYYLSLSQKYPNELYYVDQLKKYEKELEDVCNEKAKSQ